MEEKLTVGLVKKHLHPSISEEDKDEYAATIVSWCNHSWHFNAERRNWIADNLWVLDFFLLGLHAKSDVVMKIRRLSLELPA